MAFAFKVSAADALHEQGTASRFQHSVVLKLLLTVFLCSCTVTLLLTVIQLLREYDHGLDVLNTRISDIGRSNRESLGEGLWRLDRQQLQLELNGIRSLPDITTVELHEVDSGPQPMVVVAGSHVSGSVLSQRFPVYYLIKDQQVLLGNLYVEATLSNLYRALAKTAVLILLSQAANTFLIALFTIYIFSRLVTRHLASIARRVEAYDFRDTPRVFTLHRVQPGHPDELDRVVTAFNAMGERLHRAYLTERDATLQREARKSAEAANRAKSKFLANMSHELRTPLNGILGYAQILQRETALTLRQRDAVTVIHESGEHLLSLINDTLDFARIEAGKLRLESGDVSLHDVMSAIRKIIGVKAEQKCLRFVCTLTCGPGSGVRADQRRLQQVLLNLLANAVRFTDQGQVELRIEKQACGRIRFTVSDTGIGIDPEKIDSIFEPFEQAGSPERQFGGTGLGLAISRQFVRAMKSEIHARSEIGEGTVFWFDLPSANVDAAGESSAVSGSHPTGYEGVTHTLLIIDDVLVSRNVIVSLLQPLRFRIVEAASGQEGIEKAQIEPPSLVLTDIAMPGMNGFETIRRFRQLPGCCEIPIIAMSANPLSAEESLSCEDGANGFLLKPVDLDKLLALIASLLSLTWTRSPGSVSGGERPEHLYAASVALVDLEQLYTLARRGDILAMIDWADLMEARDTRHKPFADRLRHLAKGYESKAVRRLVEQCLDIKREQ